MTSITGRRVVLRALVPGDFVEWQEVRRFNAARLKAWEPSRPPGSPDVVEDPAAFRLRCNARDRERQMGAGHGFGMFVDRRFVGEVNLNSVQRGAYQNAYVGYWIDERHSGNGYTPEAVVMVLRLAFESMNLHRVQISIVPRNKASRRVVEKLGIRAEGVAERYLEINGTWEDHIRFAMTVEEWAERRKGLIADWL